MSLGLTTLATLLTVSLPGGAEAVSAPNPVASPAAPVVAVPDCAANPNMPLEGRASPLDSASVALGDGEVKLCYGRPSARGRTMLGGDEVPFGALWRTGANEATVLHTTVPLSIMGIALEPGSYAIYTIPGEDEWELFVSRSTDHWGLRITDEVREMEIGSVRLAPDSTADHVETLTFAFEDVGSRSASLVMEWEHTRLEIPVTATGN